ncbi:hypothetical protein [Streptomyces sp. NPDC096033]|uniref:hypothetical protein n=1 Tax=Streptomyces sp. NPDC096033 TaxID=3366071 RepID=UPI0038284DED
MTPTIPLAADHSDLLRHLLLDTALKAAIVAAALTVLALGMRAIWRRAGRGPRDSPHGRPPSRDL